MAEKSRPVVCLLFLIFLTGIYIICYIGLGNLLAEKPSFSSREDVDIGVRGSTVNKSGTSCHPFCIVPNRCESSSRGNFDNIYKHGVWGASLRMPSDFYSDAAWPTKNIRQKSASGLGSDLGYSTETSLRIIKETIARFNVKSMIDVPCGDVNWIFDSFETDTLPMYVGLDIVNDVIKVNEQRFAHHNNKQFHFWDAVNCVLPKFGNETSGIKQSFDLVHVRDVIQHIPPELGVKFFCNVFGAGPRVLITTSYEQTGGRTNITEGDWYPNDLLHEPFSFPKADCTPTHPNVEKDVTCVYNLTEDWVREFLSSSC